MNMKTTPDSDSDELSHTDDELSASNDGLDTAAMAIDTSADTTTTQAVELLRLLEDALQNQELLEQWRHIYTQRQLGMRARYDAIRDLPIEKKERIAELENQKKTNSRKVVYSLLYVTQGNLQAERDGISDSYSPMRQRKLRALMLQNSQAALESQNHSRTISGLLPRQTAEEIRISQENNDYLNERPPLEEMLSCLGRLQHSLPGLSHAKALLEKLLVEPPAFWLAPPAAQRSFDDLLSALITELKKPVLTTYSLSVPQKIAEAFKDIGRSFRYGILDRTPITPVTGPVPRQRRANPLPMPRRSPPSTATRPAAAPAVPLHKQMQEHGKQVMKQANKLANKVDALTDKVLPKDPPIVIISMWTWNHIIKPVGNYLIRLATPAINQLRQALGMEPLQTATRERTQADATDKTYRTFMQMADQLIKAKPTIEHLITQHPQPATLTQEQRHLVEGYLKLSQRLWSTLVAGHELREKIATIPVAQQTLTTVKAITDQVDHYYRPSPSPAPTPDLESGPVKPSISITPGKH